MWRYEMSQPAENFYECVWAKLTTYAGNKILKAPKKKFWGFFCVWNSGEDLRKIGKSQTGSYYRLVKITGKCNHTVDSLSELAVFTQHNYLEIQLGPVCSFLLLRSFPWCGWCNHSPIKGHLGSFQFSLFTTKASMDIHIQLPVWTYVFIFLG